MGAMQRLSHPCSVPDPPRRDLDVVPSENLLEVRIEAPLAKVYEALIDHEAKPMLVVMRRPMVAT